MAKAWLRTPERVYYPISERSLGEMYNVEVVRSYRGYDIIGECLIEEVEWWRPPCVKFYYYVSHRSRLDEFQQRLDLAREKI